MEATVAGTFNSEIFAHLLRNDEGIVLIPSGNVNDVILLQFSKEENPLNLSYMEILFNFVQFKKAPLPQSDSIIFCNCQILKLGAVLESIYANRTKVIGKKFQKLNFHQMPSHRLQLHLAQ